MLLVVCQNCFAGTIDPNIPDSKYIEYGKKFTCVGSLCGIYENNTKFCASAVAISDRLILTAAHVVSNYKTCIFNINNKKISIIKIIIPKEFDSSFGFHDIAIGLCSESIGLNNYPDLYEADDEVGKICAISGFGITGNFINGASTGDNQQRAGSNIIDKIDRNLLICSPSGPGLKTELEFLIAHGDSGGGLFIDQKLAGINSCVLAIDKKPDSTYTDESGHTRISIHKEWIKNTRKELELEAK